MPEDGDTKKAGQGWDGGEPLEPETTPSYRYWGTNGGLTGKIWVSTAKIDILPAKWRFP